ncbi:MAG: hypothetical protein WBG08_09750, partial [Litorimonas sp.]
MTAAPPAYPERADRSQAAPIAKESHARAMTTPSKTTPAKTIPADTTLADISRRFDAPLPGLVTHSGTVTSCAGQTVRVSGLCGRAGIGSSLLIDGTRQGDVIADDGRTVTVALYGSGQGLSSGMRAELLPDAPLSPGPDWLGRVLDHEGRDARGELPRPGPR